MEEKKITVVEAMDITINMLKSIRLPVELSDSVGTTICASIKNLTSCVAVMKNEINKKEVEAE